MSSYLRYALRAIPLLCLLSTGSAMAYDLPSVNLGLTSFLDGVLPSGGGFYYQNYLQYYTTSRFEDSAGHRLPLPTENMNLWADINQFTYYFDATVGPGRFALDVVIPTVMSARVNDSLDGRALNSQAGLGDVVFAPIYQINPVTLGNDSSLHQSLEFNILTPTGSYDRNIAINPGANVWALDPYYSMTLFTSDKLSFSGRLHYLYNFTDNEPSLALGQGAHSLRPGQAFHFNFAAAYAATPKLGLGLNGYFLKQLTETKINGTGVPGRSERVLGIGPGAIFTLDKNNFLFFNAYWETLVENRAQGERFQARFIHHF